MPGAKEDPRALPWLKNSKQQGEERGTPLARMARGLLQPAGPTW